MDAQVADRRAVLQLLPLNRIRAGRLGEAIRRPADGGPGASDSRPARRGDADEPPPEAERSQGISGSLALEPVVELRA